MNLDLTTMVFPPMAVVSILHRLSGVVLFLLLPGLLYLLELSLRDVSSFTELKLWLVSPYCKAFLWIYTSALWFHAVAGCRHLLMDIGIGESLHAGRRSSIAVMVVAALGFVVLGGLLW
jgi:succinate dehydrogenase / fumarate reductase cytochrome b subunit